MMPAKAAKPCVTPSWQLNPQKPLFHNISRCRYALLLGQCGNDGGKPVGAAVGDRNPETRSLEPGAYRKASMQVVIDDQNATHDGLLRRVKRAPRHNRERTTQEAFALGTTEGITSGRFVLRISALFTFPTQIGQSVCPPQCIRMIVQPCAIGSGNFARTEIRHAVTQLMRDRSSSRLRQEKECRRYRAHPIVCSRLCLRRSSNHCIRTSKPWNWQGNRSDRSRGVDTAGLPAPQQRRFNDGQPFRRADGGGRHDRARQPHRRLRSPR